MLELVGCDCAGFARERGVGAAGHAVVYFSDFVNVFATNLVVLGLGLPWRVSAVCFVLFRWSDLLLALLLYILHS